MERISTQQGRLISAPNVESGKKQGEPGRVVYAKDVYPRRINVV